MSRSVTTHLIQWFILNYQALSLEKIILREIAGQSVWAFGPSLPLTQCAYCSWGAEVGAREDSKKGM